MSFYPVKPVSWQQLMREGAYFSFTLDVTYPTKFLVCTLFPLCPKALAEFPKLDLVFVIWNNKFVFEEMKRILIGCGCQIQNYYKFSLKILIDFHLPFKNQATLHSIKQKRLVL